MGGGDSDAPHTAFGDLTSTASTRKGFAMGKQINKVEKRRRRRDYIQRKKNAAKAAKR
jgi:hypothetical protein